MMVKEPTTWSKHYYRSKCVKCFIKKIISFKELARIKCTPQESNASHEYHQPHSYSCIFLKVCQIRCCVLVGDFRINYGGEKTTTCNLPISSPDSKSRKSEIIKFTFNSFSNIQGYHLGPNNKDVHKKHLKAHLKHHLKPHYHCYVDILFLIYLKARVL
jgi:hypothetical protein